MRAFRIPDTADIAERLEAVEGNALLAKVLATARPQAPAPMMQ